MLAHASEQNNTKYNIHRCSREDDNSSWGHIWKGVVCWSLCQMCVYATVGLGYMVGCRVGVTNI